ncbi:hypothetical protein CXG81DRAFT_16897 [Caulochytrium protostelioides]|uniref:Protein kinase domain-containing protein n=1 Tax=Caulochytrium protostelioides TaxID=1555241 RepID=A0A4P9XDR4_9FUNG|nr:hypothetical protein CXG81DRAFT_16897 [Caulochytrium protostelioides]|eukprot:RKP03667.1 hypothetical protein CXG81DRAFT_16897 [Caulochytrium protostelioides]
MSDAAHDPSDWMDPSPTRHAPHIRHGYGHGHGHGAEKRFSAILNAIRPAASRGSERERRGGPLASRRHTTVAIAVHSDIDAAATTTTTTLPDATMPFFRTVAAAAAPPPSASVGDKSHPLARVAPFRLMGKRSVRALASAAAAVGSSAETVVGDADLDAVAGRRHSLASKPARDADPIQRQLAPGDAGDASFPNTLSPLTLNLHTDFGFDLSFGDLKPAPSRVLVDAAAAAAAAAADGAHSAGTATPVAADGSLSRRPSPVRIPSLQPTPLASYPLDAPLSPTSLIATRVAVAGGDERDADVAQSPPLTPDLASPHAASASGSGSGSASDRDRDREPLVSSDVSASLSSSLPFSDAGHAASDISLGAAVAATATASALAPVHTRVVPTLVLPAAAPDLSDDLAAGAVMDTAVLTPAAYAAADRFRPASPALSSPAYVLPPQRADDASYDCGYTATRDRTDLHRSEYELNVYPAPQPYPVSQPLWTQPIGLTVPDALRKGTRWVNACVPLGLELDAAAQAAHAQYRRAQEALFDAKYVPAGPVPGAAASSAVALYRERATGHRFVVKRIAIDACHAWTTRQKVGLPNEVVVLHTLNAGGIGRVPQLYEVYAAEGAVILVMQYFATYVPMAVYLSRCRRNDAQDAEEKAQFLWARVWDFVQGLAENEWFHGNLDDQHLLIEPSSLEMAVVGFSNASKQPKRRLSHIVTQPWQRATRLPSPYLSSTAGYDATLQTLWQMGALLVQLLGGDALDPAATATETFVPAAVLQQLADRFAAPDATSEPDASSSEASHASTAPAPSDGAKDAVVVERPSPHARKSSRQPPPPPPRALPHVSASCETILSLLLADPATARVPAKPTPRRTSRSYLSAATTAEPAALDIAAVMAMDWVEEEGSMEAKWQWIWDYYAERPEGPAHPFLAQAATVLSSASSASSVSTSASSL